MSIKPLKWDSAFFKLKVGKIANDTSITEINLSAIAAYDLIYIEKINSKKLPTVLKDLFQLKYIDRKTIYIKQLKTLNKANKLILPYISTIASKKMIALAIQSGEHSRFKLDKNFNEDLYKKLYIKWIKNSVALKTAAIVFVHGSEENPSGFITVVAQEKIARIGLISVDESKQNTGIGKALIAAAENFALHNNFTTLQVITQSENKIACAFYEKCGFKKDSEIITYHHWKQ